MAKATFDAIRKIVKVNSVTLTLSENELKLLLTVLNRVGGCPKTSVRKHADSIISAIEENGEADGVRLNHYDVDENVGRPGSIYFPNNGLPIGE